MNYQLIRGRKEHETTAVLVILQQPPVSNVAEIYDVKGKEYTQKSLAQSPQVQANNEQSQIIY